MTKKVASGHQRKRKARVPTTQRTARTFLGSLAMKKDGAPQQIALITNLNQAAMSTLKVKSKLLPTIQKVRNRAENSSAVNISTSKH
jgi:hypothetical protein